MPGDRSSINCWTWNRSATRRKPGAGRSSSRLNPYPDLLRLAPLLESVVPCGLEDNEITANMTGQVRGENTRTLLLELLAQAAARSPTLVVLDDAHWHDSASWALTSLVGRRIPAMLLLLATRPFTRNSPAEYNQLLALPDHPPAAPATYGCR